MDRPRSWTWLGFQDGQPPFCPPRTTIFWNGHELPHFPPLPVVPRGNWRAVRQCVLVCALGPGQEAVMWHGCVCCNMEQPTLPHCGTTSAQCTDSPRITTKNSSYKYASPQISPLTKVTRSETVHNLSSNSPFLLILPFDITHFLFSGTNQLNQ